MLRQGEHHLTVRLPCKHDVAGRALLICVRVPHDSVAHALLLGGVACRGTDGAGIPTPRQGGGTAGPPSTGPVGLCGCVLLLKLTRPPQVSVAIDGRECEGEYVEHRVAACCCQVPLGPPSTPVEAEGCSHCSNGLQSLQLLDSDECVRGCWAEATALLAALSCSTADSCPVLQLQLEAPTAGGGCGGAPGLALRLTPLLADAGVTLRIAPATAYMHLLPEHQGPPSELLQPHGEPRCLVTAGSGDGDGAGAGAGFGPSCWLHDLGEAAVPSSLPGFTTCYAQHLLAQYSSVHLARKASAVITPLAVAAGEVSNSSRPAAAAAAVAAATASPSVAAAVLEWGLLQV